MKVPRWLELQGEIDYLYFALGQIHAGMPKTPIDQMIDEVSGYDAARKQELREIAEEMKRLKGEWMKETGDTVSTEMEDQLLEDLNREPRRATPEA